MVGGRGREGVDGDDGLGQLGPFSAMGSLRPTHLKPQKLINLFKTSVSGPMSLSHFFLDNV